MKNFQIFSLGHHQQKTWKWYLLCLSWKFLTQMDFLVQKQTFPIFEQNRKMTLKFFICRFSCTWVQFQVRSLNVSFSLQSRLLIWFLIKSSQNSIEMLLPILEIAQKQQLYRHHSSSHLHISTQYFLHFSFLTVFSVNSDRQRHEKFFFAFLI